mmetsp:Transcript_7928/g.22710  ORF Transcript_7928/g.22710 Transcript_7928/m.22710 type:complete len:211 (+) Transcript_7928:862-1494(+)
MASSSLWSSPNCCAISGSLVCCFAPPGCPAAPCPSTVALKGERCFIAGSQGLSWPVGPEYLSSLSSTEKALCVMFSVRSLTWRPPAGPLSCASKSTGSSRPRPRKIRRRRPRVSRSSARTTSSARLFTASSSQLRCSMSYVFTIVDTSRLRSTTTVVITHVANTTRTTQLLVRNTSTEVRPRHDSMTKYMSSPTLACSRWSICRSGSKAL